MDWKTVWASLEKQFPDAFKREMESKYPDGVEGTDMAMIASTLDAQLLQWHGGAVGPAPTPGDEEGGDGTKGGRWVKDEFGNVGMWVKKSTITGYDEDGQPIRESYVDWVPYPGTTTKEAPLTQEQLAGTNWGTGPLTLLPSGEVMNNPFFEKPQTAAQIEAARVALDRADRDRFIAAQQDAAELAQRQEESKWKWAQQAQANVFQPQPTEPQMPSTEPTNWINYWKAGQDVAKRQVAAEQRQGAINWSAANLNPTQVAEVGRAYNPVNIGQYGGNLPSGAIREAIDPFTGQKVQWLQARQMNMPGVGIEDNKQMWDPLTQSYRPETDQEYAQRIAAMGVGAGVFTPQQTQQAQWSQFYDQSGGDPAQKQAWMEQQAVMWRQPTPTGPETPAWAGGVLQNPQANINLQTLGQPGNMVRPVSAGMYQGWSPTQQQSYQGLASAQRYIGGEPYQWPDYKANIEKMWGASRPGQQARQKVPSWSY